MSSRTGITRRSFVARGAAAAALAVGSPFAALAEAEGSPRRGRRRRARGDYGPLQPLRDATTGLRLLELPEDFRYASFGWTGERMDGHALTPDRHDGMAAFPLRGRWRGWLALVRNHERSAGAAIPDGPVYDPAAGGGTTTALFDPRRGRALGAYASLSGTLRNCAGGPTPWGSWISCEETRDGPFDGPLQQEHGFCFEVPARGRASAQPLRDMGRFAHEAVAFDPRSGAAFLTEDSTNAGLYRFLPHSRGRLAAGGVLQMLRVAGAPHYDARRGQRPGVALDVDWVDIPNPAPAGRRAHVDANAVFLQGFFLGGARFTRLEGAWYGNGLVYFTSTDGGDAFRGQVWAFDPRRDQLVLVYESPGAHVLDSPDNVCVSPRGGVVLCEDGVGRDRLVGLDRDGTLFPFCNNSVRLMGEGGFVGDFSSSEFAGACWSPSGRWLFANVQVPGITLAITGPWRRGGL